MIAFPELNPLHVSMYNWLEGFSRHEVAMNSSCTLAAGPTSLCRNWPYFTYQLVAEPALSHACCPLSQTAAGGFWHTLLLPPPFRQAHS